MISQLTGKVAHIDSKYIVLDVNGVGYKVSLVAEAFIKIAKGKTITLSTHLAVRENALDLYGFLSLEELNFFELLITISGIGPKTAMGILNVAPIHTLEIAIQTGETSHLTKIAGIGKKIAEKIVMELKDKVVTEAHTPEQAQTMRDDSDVLEALKSLGYSPTEARDVLKRISKTFTKTSDKIKEALKILGR